VNIKIGRELCDKLLNNTKSKVLFGSEGGEDKDYLCILPPNIQMDCAFHNRDHFLFFKDEELKIDYLFATPRCLLNGVVTGSSPLLYQLMAEGKFRPNETWNTFSCGNFITHKLAKSFLGIAKRDLKQSKRLRGAKLAKKLLWVDRYRNIVTDMLDEYEIPYSHSKENFLDLSFAIKYLPIDNSFIQTAMSVFPKPVDIPELNSVESVLYKNWEESL
tara:strand:- start:1941 stop:2591 length:651 start_codon:yes stop_codon:yes gene_type:complete